MDEIEATRTSRSRLARIATFLVTTVIGLVVLTGTAVALTVAVVITITVPPVAPIVAPVVAPVTNLLSYDIRTQLNAGGGCSGERTVKALYGVPKLVDIGGSALPDVLVLALPLPAIPGVTSTTLFSLTVTKLQAGTLPALVEAVVAPGGQDAPGRVALGYDACESTAPGLFTTQATSSDTRLSVDARPANAGTALTVLAGSFTRGPLGVRIEQTSVRARLAPVPSRLTAAVDILPAEEYKAHLTSSVPTNLVFDYLKEKAPAVTKAHLTLADLPETSDITFSPTAGSYVLSAPVQDSTLQVTKAVTGEDTLQVDAHIVGLPASVGFVRNSPTHAKFTTDGTIGAAAVRYASYAPGSVGDLPALSTSTVQHLDALVGEHLTNVDIYMEGIGTSGLDWGDQVKLDLLHKVGRFELKVLDPAATVTGSLDQLPADVHVTYGRTDQHVHYTGSGVIDTMTVDMVSVAPIVGRAHHAHALITGIPTGLDAVLSTGGKSFTVQMTGSRLGRIELLLTNGPTRTMGPRDGLFFLDPAPATRAPRPTDPYEVFLRASQISSATFGWGTPIAVDIDHVKAPFDLEAHIWQDLGDLEHPFARRSLDLAGTLDQLPGVAHVKYYAPVSSIGVGLGGTGRIGGGGPGPVNEGDSASHIVYDADAVMHELHFRVESSSPLIEDAGEIQVDLTDLPTHLDLNVDGVRKELSAATTGPALGKLEARVGTNLDACVACMAGDGDGINLVDLDGVHWLAELKLSNIAGAAASWASDVHVELQAGGKPFSIFANTDKLDGHHVLQTKSVRATITNLPTDIDLTVSRDGKHVHYEANHEISLLELTAQNSPDPIVVTAHRVDAIISSLPTDVDLVLGEVPGAQTGSSGFSVDMGASAVGKATIWLSDDGVVDGAPLGTSNGVLIDDFASGFELFAQAKGVKHIDFNTFSSLNTGDLPTERHLEIIDAHLRFDRTGRDPYEDHSLMVLRRSDATSSYKVDGKEHLLVTYADPPEDTGIRILRNIHGSGDTDEFQITYDGNRVGNGLVFTTDSGANRTELRLAVDAMPVHMRICAAPAHGYCFDENTHRSVINELSYDVEITPLPNGALTHLTMRDCKESIDASGYSGPIAVDDKTNCVGVEPVDDYVGGLVEASLYFEKRVAVHSEDNENCDPFACALITLHTDDGELHGDLTQWDDSTDLFSPDLKVIIPPGFKASYWGVEIDCDAGCSGTALNPDGRVTCPVGIQMFKHIGPIINFELAEELCPKAELTGVSPSRLPRGATEQLVHLRGKNFASGAAVSFGPGVQVLSVRNVGYDQLDVVVSVDQLTAPGTRRIDVYNIEGIDTTWNHDLFTVD